MEIPPKKLGVIERRKAECTYAEGEKQF